MNRETQNFSGEMSYKNSEKEFPNVLNLANRILKLPLRLDSFSEVPFSETVFGKIMLLREQTLNNPKALLEESFINVLKAFEKALDDDMKSEAGKSGTKPDPEMLQKRNVFYNEYVEPVLNVAAKKDEGKPRLTYQIKTDLREEFSKRRDLSENNKN